MRCPACTTENDESRRFCGQCGASLVGLCPACGFVNRPSDKFCGGCGEAIASSSVLDATKPDKVKPAPSSEDGSKRGDTEPSRRQLSVMFCDLVGSTALSERLDPEELSELLATYQDTCSDVIGRLDGYISRYIGDALPVYFGYPQAHEDDAQRAVRAGLSILEAIDALKRQANPIWNSIVFLKSNS